MAIASNFPAIKPSLLLDFANTKKLDSRVTFTRTTTATYYDGVTTAMAEQNLILESQALNSSSWDRGSTTVSDNSVAAPDGTTTASTATTSAAGSSLRTIAITVQPSTTYTFSFFALRGTMSDLKYSIYNNTAASDIVAPTSYYASTNASTWSRLSFTFTTPAGCTSIFCFLLRDSIATGTVFLWGAQLEQRSSVSSYTATTTQPITNYIPVLLTAASGVARFQHNPTTDESLGLLIEEARTNSLTYSADFSNAAWVKTRSSITSNTIVAPDGTLTGDKLVEDTTASNTHFVNQSASVTNPTQYTVSVYLKAGERTIVDFITASGTATYSAISVNLTLGTIGPPITGLPSAVSTSTITSVGNGWYRITMNFVGASGGFSGCQVRLTNGTTESYTGDGYSGIYIWGAQLEAGAFPTSYIATTAATVTRNADIATMTGSNFTSWYNAAEGAIYCESQTVSLAADRGTWAIGNPTLGFSSSNAIYEIYTSGSGVSGKRSVSVITNGAVQVNTLGTNTAQTINTFSKGAFAYKVNDFAQSTNADTAFTDSSGTVPIGPTALSIGSLASGWSGATTYLNGTIKKLAYYPLRVTNAQLQALTS